MFTRTPPTKPHTHTFRTLPGHPKVGEKHCMERGEEKYVLTMAGYIFKPAGPINNLFLMSFLYSLHTVPPVIMITTTATLCLNYLITQPQETDCTVVHRVLSFAVIINTMTLPVL